MILISISFITCDDESLENNHVKAVVIDIQKLAKEIYYSDKYNDDEYEYRHVMLPKELSKLVPKDHLMSENEWRSIGVQQSRGNFHRISFSLK